MTEKHFSRLNSSQEALLMKVLDGEANAFERVRAKLLLMMVPAAEVFLDSMRRVSEETARVVASSSKVDLWSRIETRIEQEEHAALFLGQRNVRLTEQEPRRGVFEILGLRQLSGAVVAASVLGAVFVARDIMNGLPAQQSGVGVSSIGTSINRPLASPVSYASQEVGSLSSGPDPVEVDWMRSGGEVSFVKDRAKKPAIIWVRMAPSADETSVTSVAERPVIIEERVPQAVTVSGR